MNTVHSVAVLCSVVDTYVISMLHVVSDGMDDNLDIV